MRRYIPFPKRSLRYFYYHFKDSPYYSLLISCAIIFVCILLFMQIVVPQVEKWFSIRNEITATKERIANVNSNISYISSLNDLVLNANLNTATSSLPSEKDFSGILAAISSAALHAHVGLDDFSFQVGQVVKKTKGTEDAVPVKMVLVIHGDVEGVKQFVSELAEKVPLSEVEDIDMTDDRASITVQFYNKPFPPIVYHDTTPVKVITYESNLLMQRLSSWKASSQFGGDLFIQSNDASESASPF